MTPQLKYNKTPRGRASAKRWEQSPAGKLCSRRKALKKIGLTIETWNAFFTAQGACCKVCKSPDPGQYGHWATDHCHATNQFRGILCFRCNLALGHAGDDPVRLRQLADYLDGAAT